jgi:hypothetical protein
LSVTGAARTAKALEGIKGKRLTIGGLVKQQTPKQKAKHCSRRRQKSDSSQ